MPQTRHAFIGLIAVFGVFLSTLAVTTLENPLQGGSFATQQPASVLSATEETHEVIIGEDTTRAETRRELRERLQTYVREGGDRDGEAYGDGTIELAETIEPEQSKSILCEPDATPATVPDFGPVNSGLRDGTRTITTSGADAQTVLEIPATPVVTGVTSCLPNRTIAVLFDGTTLAPNEPVHGTSEGIIGYAIDGFPLYGSSEEGKILTSGDLDVCHGHEHGILVEGVVTTLYHYHVTEDAPYALGCLRGSLVLE